MNFNHYFTNTELEQILTSWSQAFPSLFRLEKLGISYQGSPLWIGILTQTGTGSDTQKPALWIDANIHATELAGTTTVLHTLHTLLQGYGSDPQITRLLDSCTLYAVPRINPDGAALALSDSPRLLRSGTRPYPWPDPDQPQGLQIQDMDGDGRILQMRIPDPSGDWQISDQDPRLMVKRAPDQNGGEYYRLFYEGWINEFDGYLIKTNRLLSGIDFNRNFPYRWRPQSEQHGSGSYPASESEIRAVVEFIVAHPNINLALTYHTHGGLILRPFSDRPDTEFDRQDLRVYEKLGQRGSQITGYPCISIFHEFRSDPNEVTTGAFDDWMYDHLGAFAFTIELWNLPQAAGVEFEDYMRWRQDHPPADQLKMLQWCDRYAAGWGYVEWYGFDHPQLGPIELGGWQILHTWRNPPPDLMEAEAARHTPFVISLAETLPHLAVWKTEVETLAAGIYRIVLVVENTGFLPTYTSQQGRQRDSARPVRVRIDLPEDLQLISGNTTQDLGHLEGRSTKLSPLYTRSSPTDNRAWCEWTVKGAAEAQIGFQILSDRAGVIHHQIQLI